MTKAKRQTVEDYAQAFITLTGTRIVIDAAKYEKFRKAGVDVSLFHSRDALPALAQ